MDPTIELLPARRGARRAGLAVTLTRAEYTLLATLIAGHGDAVSHRELIDRLWGVEQPDDRPTRNRIQAHVSALRRKLDDPHNLDTIRAIYDLGYLLDQ